VLSKINRTGLAAARKKGTVAGMVQGGEAKSLWRSKKTVRPTEIWIDGVQRGII